MSNFDITNFEAEVIKKSYDKAVVVDFWAEWCGPCKILGPVLEKLANEENGKRWILAKVDTEQHKQVAIKYRIQSIPAVKLFKDGQVIDEFVGALPEDQIRQWFDKALPSPFAEKIEQVEYLVQNDQLKEANKILNNVLKHEPGNENAKVLLAQIKVFDEPETALELVSNIEITSDLYERAESIKTFYHLFSYLNGKELPDQKIKETYEKAITALRDKNFEVALQNFIKVIQLNRDYDNDGARKACIAIFKWLGEDNQVTRKYRSLFSSALYS